MASTDTKSCSLTHLIQVLARRDERWVGIRARQHRQRVDVVDVRVGHKDRGAVVGRVASPYTGVQQDADFLEEESGPFQRSRVAAQRPLRAGQAQAVPPERSLRVLLLAPALLVRMVDANVAPAHLVLR